MGFSTSPGGGTTLPEPQKKWPTDRNRFSSRLGQWYDSGHVFEVFMRAATEIEELEKTEEEVGLDRPWNVVVHNDPVNLMSYVTMVFRRVFGHSLQKAEDHMWEVHRNGRSIVWTGGRERAEFYVQQLHGHLLLATLEAA